MLCSHARRERIFLRDAGQGAGQPVRGEESLTVSAIDLRVDGPVARVTLDYPERHNALTRRGLERMHAHLETIEANADIRVLVVGATGGRTFCSGAALDEVRAGALNGEIFQAMADRLAALPIPKLAAMNGSAYGGGVELGLCCDFRVGVEGMKIRVPAATFGLCYPPNGIRRFVTRLGSGAAKRILVAAETLEARELLRIGYLHRLCGAEELDRVVDHWARDLAGLAPLAVRAMLAIIDGTADGTLDADLARARVRRCNASSDLREGLRAALEKRRPEFTGE
jgi:enoyl-CoA hydratase/carnithine racemase